MMNWLDKMTLRETFSSNLRRLCEREPSIAAVCRAAAINRQQFNRYLSGATFPTDSNLRKICRHFGVSEEALYSQQLGMTPAAEQTGNDAPAYPKDLRAIMDLVEADAAPSVSPGLYFAHFAHPHDPTSIMRSVIVLKRDGKFTTFRRLTGRSERRGSWWSHFHGDHRGIVLERRHCLYLVALNHVGTKEPTQLVLRWVPNSDPILGGHAAILSPIGPTVTAVVVTPCPAGLSLRGAIRASHVYAKDSPDIAPIIIDSLEQQCEDLIGMVCRLKSEGRPIDA